MTLVWTYFGHNQQTWTPFGHDLDTLQIWTCFGYILATFWTLSYFLCPKCVHPVILKEDSFFSWNPKEG